MLTRGVQRPWDLVVVFGRSTVVDPMASLDAGFAPSPQLPADSEPASLVVSAFQWLLGGCLLAGVSVLLFKHTLIRGAALRIANLVLAPIASAYLGPSGASRA
jgi:hypothetical protein